MPFSPHRTDIQVRFGDTDALGHVNNASYAAYAEVARLHFLAVIGTTVRSLILASLYVDYRKQVDYDDRVHVESWIEKLGNSSMSILQTIYANDEVAADIRSVVVHFDYATNKSRQIDSAMREQLAPFTKPARIMSILAVCGSLQARSSNLALLQALARALAPRDVVFSNALHELPPFNSDLDTEDPPPAVARWRAELASADAVLFATPEYAFGIAGAIKNSLDWVVGSGELVHKPVALLGASTLETGAGLALEALERTIRVMTADVTGVLSVPFVRAKVAPDGTVTDDATLASLAELARGVVSRLGPAA
jgi:chromate reductase, NAD(P)H dehydrogenase (quinone)